MAMAEISRRLKRLLHEYGGKPASVQEIELDCAAQPEAT